MAIILIDGVSASGKSAALQNLDSVWNKTTPCYSKLIITEHFTERYFEGKHISKATVTQHIESILDTIRQVKQLHDNSPFARKTEILNVYIERLLLTFYSRNLIDEQTISRFAEILSIWNSTHYLLIIPPSKFKVRLADTIERRNAVWKTYINDTLGGIDQAAFHFQAQQEAMLEGHSKLSKYMKTQVITVEDPATDFYKAIQ